ncbi:hypothetical protein NYR55_09575 [Sphingomonas sp. BGYR3]|uniref:hypothetical protein n=1 Tax=Sphingomonas sp. BGYR3 TaxID=2975483 RepID=UPI0021A6BAB0|nr:hypothetical protein [Sphingomonas sp. BGYR3]MDG5488863.1 hypothetical protein [Sphingomonas sp. BGYR3]
MIMVQAVEAVSAHQTDRVMQALIAGLEIEFGHGAGEALAQRFIEAEESDFLWQARVTERWLGSYGSAEEDAVELDRIAVLSRLDHRWFVAVSIVDGDGNAHGLIGRRQFRSEQAARQAFATAH